MQSSYVGRFADIVLVSAGEVKLRHWVLIYYGQNCFSGFKGIWCWECSVKIVGQSSFTLISVQNNDHRTWHLSYELDCRVNSLLYIRAVPGLNLGWKIDCPKALQLRFWQMSRHYFRTDQDSFISCFCKLFTTHPRISSSDSAQTLLLNNCRVIEVQQAFLCCCVHRTSQFIC